MVSSNANALGVIFANSYDNLVPELVAERTMASIPFAGRYRMIDFVLSNMANAGVDNVSVIVRKNYHCLGANRCALADLDTGANRCNIAGFGNIQAAFRHFAHGSTFFDGDIFGHDEVFDLCASLDDSAAHNNGCFNSGALFDHNAGEQDGVFNGAVNLAAFGDHRVHDVSVRTNALAGAAGVAGVDLLVFIKHGKRRCG